ncbi:unannotated protein [freshwater metagenome]|uniref:Unannotated protein n=1 Tax=freshwater metagenome TaxID=449393 RepID=A0A6J7GZG2_9ZZZZ|nr:hypothetical protein [Actinomycetota bacterium]
MSDVRLYPVPDDGRGYVFWRWLLVDDGRVIDRGVTFTRWGARRQAARARRRLR